MNFKLFYITALLLGFISSYAQTQDTIIDSNYSWKTLQSKFTWHYKQSLSEQNFEKYQEHIQQMTLINVYYYGYDQNIHRGQIVCHKNVAQDLRFIFNQLLWLEFPIYSAIPVSEFNYDDNLSMQANNTTCFDFRMKTLKNGWSKHTYGTAIDLNPIQNPFITRNRIFPNTALPFLKKGRIRANDKTEQIAIEIFKLYGWTWGGNWNSSKDYMHFEVRN